MSPGNILLFDLFYDGDISQRKCYRSILCFQIHSIRICIFFFLEDYLLFVFACIVFRIFCFHYFEPSLISICKQQLFRRVPSGFYVKFQDALPAQVILVSLLPSIPLKHGKFRIFQNFPGIDICFSQTDHPCIFLFLFIDNFKGKACILVCDIHLFFPASCISGRSLCFRDLIFSLIIRSLQKFTTYIKFTGDVIIQKSSFFFIGFFGCTVFIKCKFRTFQDLTGFRIDLTNFNPSFFSLVVHCFKQKFLLFSRLIQRKILLPVSGVIGRRFCLTHTEFSLIVFGIIKFPGVIGTLLSIISQFF